MNIPKEHTVGSEQYENRPYLIVSRTEINRRGTVIGVPFTSVKDPSKMSSMPPYWITVPQGEVDVDWGAHLQAVASIAKTDQIRVLAGDRLGTKIGKVSDTALLSVRLGVQFALDIQDQ